MKDLFDAEAMEGLRYYANGDGEMNGPDMITSGGRPSRGPVLL